MTEEEDQEKIRNTEINTALKKGIEQGIEKGKKENQIEFIKESYANGLDIDMISKITKLAKEEVTNILNNN
jgi:predicted transposase/invertase (TIGR01784 family)